MVLKPGREKDEAMRESIVNYMKEKVAPYKVPKYVSIRQQLPKNILGKILKKELKAALKGEGLLG